MLKTALLKLVPVILGLASGAGSKNALTEDHPVMVRADARAAEIIEVVETMVTDPVQQETWKRALFGWEFWESAWHVNPPGNNDNGSAHGVLQMHAPENIIPGVTGAMLRKDAKLAVKVALTYLLEREKACGSKAAAWTAYSTDGSCRSKPMKLVQYRCKRVGLTAACELPVEKK